MTLPVDGQVAKALFTVDEYLTEKRYGELTALLLDLAETHAEELVVVPSETNAKSIHYLNVALHAQRIMAAFPPEGLAACRARLDPSAKRWFEAWRATGDESQLQRIVRSAYVSRYGDNALWELGQLAWDRGDFSQAAAYWGQLVADDKPRDVSRFTYPDPEFASADVTARLILCDIFSRHFTEAERKLAKYRQDFPEADGLLAGRQGRWPQLLQDVLEEARSWEISDRQTMTTFGGAKERQRTWTENLDLGPLHWSKDWPVRQLPRTYLPPLQDRGPLVSFPVIDGQYVFLNDGEAIHAWNILSGEPAWPNDQADPSIIYPPVPMESSPLPTRPCVGTPWRTVSVSQGKLLARMGSPLTGATDSEHGDLVSELVCLDIRHGEGKLLWKLSADDLPGTGRPWSFEGTPVIVESTAYGVLYRRRPEAEFALVSLDIATGQVHWLKSIGAVRPNLEEGVNRVSHLLLTSGDGRLYLSTDQGTMLAFSQDDGRPLWAVSYESQPQTLVQNVPAHLQTGLLPPVFSQGLLFVAPNDGNLLYCLEASSGRIVWQRVVPDSSDQFRHLLGVTSSPGQGRLIASGNSLWAINISDGTLGWRLTQEDRTEGSYGQGLLSGQSVFWPTREWLYQVNQRTGDLERKLPLHADAAGHSGGNLVVADGVMIIVESDRIAVYGEYSLLKKRLKLELSQQDSQPALWRRLMNLEASVQNWDAAEEAARKAWSFRQMLSPEDMTSLELGYVSILWRLIPHQQEQGQFSNVTRLYQELSELALSPTERNRLLWEWSKFDVRQDQTAQAVSRLHQLLEQLGDSPPEIDGQPAQQAVTAELSRILQSAGRPAFAEVDRAGTAQLNEALTAGDILHARKVLKRYPLLESAGNIWTQLIADQSRRKNWSAVWPLLEEWRGTVTAEVGTAVIAERKIALLRQAGYDRTADRLQRLPVEPGSAWHYTARGWSRNVSPSDHVIVPNGMPPSNQSAGVLLSGTELAFLDRATGGERWRTAASTPVLWAGYGETNLLIAFADNLTAVSLESGSSLWTRAWSAAGTSPADMRQQLDHTSDRLIRIHPDHGVSAISTITGDVLWEFKPRQGRLQAIAARLGRQILLQTLEPAAFLWVDAEIGRLTHSESGTPERWRYPPTDLGSQRFACVTADRKVLRWGPPPVDPRKFAAAISHAHTDPWLFADGRNLALLIDGVTLTGLNPERGEPLWSTGLSDLPITDPSHQVAIHHGIAVTAWSNRMRAVELETGNVAWESVLPHGIADWRLQAWADLIAVSGSTSSTEAKSVLLLFDAATGTPRQTIQLKHAASAGTWHIDEQGPLWTSSAEIHAYHPLPTSN